MSTGNGNDDAPPQAPSQITTPSKVQLSEREQEILSKAWNCMKTQPEIDYNRLAEATGMTNPRSASNAWSSLKKKLFTGGFPATPTKAKGGTASDSAEATGEASDKKRKRATPAKKAKAVTAKGDDENGGDTVHTPTKKKRSAAKKKTSTGLAAETKKPDGADAEQPDTKQPDAAGEEDSKETAAKFEAKEEAKPESVEGLKAQTEKHEEA